MDDHERFAGLEIVNWEEGQALEEPARRAYRISVEYEAEHSWVDTFSWFLECAGVEAVRALVVGPWGDVATGDPPEPAIEALVGAREKLPNLEALFIGDIAQEESEISWIHQGDLSPLLSAYPRLLELRARGGQGLTLGKLAHPALRSLAIETGGLDRSIVREVIASQLPALEHLELWLGDDNYGANTTPEDFAPILEGALFPKLKTLALRNCHYADVLAPVVANAKILERIETLDLSLGNLSDAGAEAFLDAPRLRRLKKLDLHHHYLSIEMMERLRTLAIPLDLEDRREADDWDGKPHRYIAVSE